MTPGPARLRATRVPGACPASSLRGQYAREFFPTRVRTTVSGAHDPEAKVTPVNRTHRGTPAGRSLPAVFRRLFALVPLLASVSLPALAQGGPYATDGTLTEEDPTYQRAYLNGDGSCSLSTIGTAVHYDVFELLLEADSQTTDLYASLCTQTDFDSVLAFYQRPNGAPGAFDASAPCARLIAYDDDGCGPASRIDAEDLVRGVLTIIVTGYANTTTGSYHLAAESNFSPVDKLLFYCSFETGGLGTWSSTRE